LKKETSILITHPKLCLEWDNKKNTRDILNVSRGTNYKAFWTCKKGHSWQASVSSRTRGSGCPYCHSSTSLRELLILSEVSLIFPKSEHRYLLDKVECDIYIPSIKVGIEHDGYRWHKDSANKDLNKNIFFKKKGIEIIRVRQTGLEKLSIEDIIVSKKGNDKQLINSILIRINEIKPNNRFKSVIKNYIDKESLQNQEYYNKLLDYHPYPFKNRSLADKFPHLLSEWNEKKNEAFKPDHFHPKSGVRVWWQCKEGHQWIAPINRRVYGSGCPYCSGRVAGEFNNLNEINPDLVKEWNKEKNEFNAKSYLPNSGKKVWWKCEKGHEWIASIASRNSNKVGCPYCSGTLTEEKNSIVFKHPELASDWNYEKNKNLNIKSIGSGSNKKAWWNCKKGH
jgi:hypothetical protein